MNIDRSSIIISLLVTLLSIHSTLTAELVYHIMEEQGSHFLCNVAEDAELASSVSESVYATLQYSIVKQDSENFDINSSSDITTTKKIDRENLCQNQQSCFEDIEVLATSTREQFLKKIPIRIYIDDMNDNSPTFFRNSITKSISEGATLTRSFPLITASDLDSAVNAIQNIYVDTNNVPFKVSFDRNIGGVVDVSIQLKNELDREIVDSYTFQLVAVDGGTPIKTGTVSVTILLDDVNDNKPQFVKVKYNTSLSEDSQKDTFVIQVSATDRDVGLNGKVHYQLSSMNAPDVMEVFAINETTGRINTKAQLSHLPNDPYTIIVQVFDSGLEPQSGQTVVTVHIIDTTNDPPSIRVNLLGQSEKAHISEFAEVGTVVVYLSVEDNDPGTNGLVSCSIRNSKFSIRRLDDTGYKVILASVLDSESKGEHNFTVVCQDSGNPPLQTSVVINVEVIDENDHSPYFPQNTYSVSIEENNAIGEFIMQVTAFDDDSGANGEIVYSLAENNNTIFEINPQNGRINARTDLDYENKTHYTLVVFATDRGDPRLSASTVIKLDVLDKNDNEPLFIMSVFVFDFLENMPTDSTVGRLGADDADSGLNGVVTFELASPYETSFPFVVFQNGIIKTNRELDRETQSSYTFLVKASDQGAPSFSSVAKVIVNVLDMNDNDPQVLFPNKLNHSVIIYHTLQPGSLITKLRAFDEDEGRESQLTYTLESLSDMIQLSLSGQVILKREMKMQDAGIHKIILSVSDNGKPQRTKRTELDINVVYYNSTAMATPRPGDKNGDTQKEENQDYAIVAIVLSCVTVVIAAAIITVIIVIRRYDSCTGGSSRKGRTPPKNNPPPMKVPLDEPMVNDGIPVDMGKNNRNNYLILKDNYTDGNTSLDSGRGTSSTDLPVQTYLSESVLNKSDDKVKAMSSHKALLESHGIQWPVRQADADKMRKFLEDVEHANQEYPGSESSGETVSDSGRGGSSEEDSMSNTDGAHYHDIESGSYNCQKAREEIKNKTDQKWNNIPHYNQEIDIKFQRTCSGGKNTKTSNDTCGPPPAKRVHFSNSSHQDLRTFRADRPPSETMDNHKVDSAHTNNPHKTFPVDLQLTSFYDANGVPFKGASNIPKFQAGNRNSNPDDKVILSGPTNYMEHVEV